MYDVDPLRGQTAATDKRAALGRRYLKEAEERLLRHGFVKEQIQTRIKSASGICNAIREEAERGRYDAVLIGRRGLGTVGNMFFGSTSADLIEKCHRSPLWIVDGTVTTSRFLLAVHSHPSSLMAADHLAFMLKEHPRAEIHLYHSNSVFGSQTPARAEDFHAQWGKAWCDQYLDLDNFLFYAHAQLLADNGFSRHRVKQLPTQMHLDVSSDLLKQAKQHNCGTIVIGRRRRDLSRGQLKGVSDKTVKQAQNVAVWLAG
jgi:nucleotide-binding universal stress UspA family protein